VPFLKDKLALKGGTAIHFTMLHLPRLSVDIDFDFVNPCTKEEMSN
jgi:predicted nucleotidyltransferase component of viral defense system